MQFDTQEQKIFFLNKIMNLPAEDVEGNTLKLKEVSAHFAKFVQPVDVGVVIALEDQVIPKKYKPKEPKKPTPIKPEEEAKETQKDG